MDWNLRSCSRKGHVTYAPSEPEFRAKLEADTPLGDAWRCLRCGNYVLGDPHGSGRGASERPEQEPGCLDLDHRFDQVLSGIGASIRSRISAIANLYTTPA